jgi:hypothetical protein
MFWFRVVPLFLNNNTDSSNPNSFGIHLFQDQVSNDAILEHRSNPNNAFSIRHKDDTTKTVSSLLDLMYDDKTDVNRYAANINGRINASEFMIGTSDMRQAFQPGLYTSINPQITAQFRVNKGTGDGGFKFNTVNADGSVIPSSEFSVDGTGLVTANYYTQTNDTQDTESVSLLGLDTNGKWQRDYQSNKRFRQAEERMNSLETELVGDVPDKINEVINRTNGLLFFSQNISTIAKYVPGLNNQISFPIIYPSTGAGAKMLSEGTGQPWLWGGGQYDGASNIQDAISYVLSVAPNALCAAWSGDRINWYANATDGGSLQLVDGSGWVAIQFRSGLPGGA